jgi:hypothetical protein
MKKIIGICIVIFLIGTSLQTVNSEKTKNQVQDDFKIIIEEAKVINTNMLDQLDQSQTNYDYDKLVGCDNYGYRLAQSFVPTLPTLTRFSVYISATFDMMGGWRYPNHRFAIRKGSLTSSDVKTFNIDSSQLPQGYSYWLTIYGFTPVTLTPGATYYIVLYGIDVGYWMGAELYWWYKSGGNAYLNGEGYVLDQPDPTWWPLFGGGDYCFKTYGEPGGGNNPPNTPSKPSGPAIGDIGTSYSYSTSADDIDGDQVQYRFDWDASGTHDYSSWTPLGVSGHTDSLSHTWSSDGSFVVKAQARDDNNDESGWSNGLTVTISAGNTAPHQPSITGPLTGKAGTPHAYAFTSTDPDGDDVSYLIKWGEVGTPSWTAFQASGTPYTESHTWTAQGAYTIEAKSKDIHGDESGWTTLSVTMPRSISFLNRPILNFLQQHPNLFPMLRQLLLKL